MDLLTQIKTSADFILKQSKYKPEIGLILGSGLGSLADAIEDAEYYNYSDIPNFPTYRPLISYVDYNTLIHHHIFNINPCIFEKNLRGIVSCTVKISWHYHVTWSRL